MIDCSVVQVGWHIILHQVYGFSDKVSGWSDKGINLTVSRLSQLQENDRAFTDDLVDHKGTDNDQEDGAESKHEMELPSKDVIVGVFEEVVGNLIQVLGLKVLLLNELLL